MAEQHPDILNKVRAILDVGHEDIEHAHAKPKPPEQKSPDETDEPEISSETAERSRWLGRTAALLGSIDTLVTRLLGGSNERSIT